jgi:exonuclease III
MSSDTPFQMTVPLCHSETDAISHTNKDTTSHTSPAKTTLTLTSLNIRGSLRTKWKEIKKLYLNTNTDILTLQETKLTKEEWTHIVNPTKWLVIANSPNRKKKRKGGMAIVIHITKAANFIVPQNPTTPTPYSHKMQILELHTNQTTFTIFNIHAPNKHKDNSKYWHTTLPSLLRNTPPTNTPIILGDFNAYSNRIDSYNPNPKISKALKNFISHNNLVDTYRMINPTNREYTWTSHNGKAKTRIDTIITHKDVEILQSNIKYTNIDTDHQAVSTTLSIEITVNNITHKPKCTYKIPKQQTEIDKYNQHLHEALKEATVNNIQNIILEAIETTNPNTKHTKTKKKNYEIGKKMAKLRPINKLIRNILHNRPYTHKQQQTLDNYNNTQEATLHLTRKQKKLRKSIKKLHHKKNRLALAARIEKNITLAQKNDPKLYKKISHALNPRNNTRLLAVNTGDHIATSEEEVIQFTQKHWKQQFSEQHCFAQPSQLPHTTQTI